MHKIPLNSLEALKSPAFIHQQVYHIFIEQYTFYSDV